MARPTPQEIQDLRDAPKTEKAYMDALTVTAPAPKKEPPKKPAPKKYAHGGSVRGNGIAQRGKTRA